MLRVVMQTLPHETTIVTKKAVDVVGTASMKKNNSNEMHIR
jgi:hypothetical protein